MNKDVKNLPGFREKANWKVNPFKLKLLNRKGFPFKNSPMPRIVLHPGLDWLCSNVQAPINVYAQSGAIKILVLL